MYYICGLIFYNMIETRCKNCKFYNPKDDLHGECLCGKFVIGSLNFSKDNTDYVKVEEDEGWGFLVGINFGCIHFAYKNNDFQFVKSMIEEQRKINIIQTCNDYLADIINNNPDLPLEIAKRLEYNPDDTKNVDIEFNKEQFLKKQEYDSFVNSTLLQLHEGHIDFIKAIQDIQNYKTY